MHQRGISEAEVAAVLATHYSRRQDLKGNDVLIGRVAGRRIKVVVDNRTSPPEILTVAD
jgi:hypothetical protein